MTFIDRKTSKAAQERRRQKDDRGRRCKYETPGKPDTNLAYSLTGRGNGAQSDMAAALREAGLVDERKPQQNRKPRKRPQRSAPVRPKGKSPAAAMARVAKARRDG